MSIHLILHLTLEVMAPPFVICYIHIPIYILLFCKQILRKPPRLRIACCRHQRDLLRFYVFPDGTYLYGENGNETIYGEFYIIENGVMRKIANDGQHMGLTFI